MTAAEIISYARKEQFSEPSNRIILELDPSDLKNLVEYIDKKETELKNLRDDFQLVSRALQRVTRE